MNNLQLFEHEQLGSVRIVMQDGEPWFVAKDVAEILGYANPRKAIADHVDPEDKIQGDGVTIRDSIGREQNPTCVNESGLYSLILSSKLPEAKAFKRWITHDVLPAIRKTGAYAAPGAITSALSEMHSAMQQMRTLLQDMQQKGRLDLGTLSTRGSGARRFLDHEKIKRKISVYMIEEDLDTDDLAALLGVDKRSVFRYRSGEYAPCGEALAKLCDLLGCDVSELLI